MFRTHWNFLTRHWLNLVYFFFKHKEYYLSFYQFFIVIYIIFILSVAWFIALPAMYGECLAASISQSFNRMIIFFKTWF
jgi:hypothetical protein